MALLAMVMPIVPGKKEMWEEMAAKLDGGPMRDQLVASREAAGVRERTFLQETPHGDFVIVTLEGDDPAAAFGKMMAEQPEEFKAWAAEVHGFDPNEAPPIPKLVFDTKK
jgi:hypothetical protein